MKATGWAFAALILVAFIFVLLCKPRKEDSFYKGKYQALEKTISDTAKYYEELLLADSNAIELAVAHAEQKSEVALNAEFELDIYRVENKKLIKQLKDARLETGPDDSWLSVSPRYVNACDSLERSVTNQDVKIVNYERANKTLAESVKEQKAAYEKKLQTQTNFNSALRKQLDTCKLDLKAAEAGPERRTQVYGGFNLYCNKTDLVSGGQACVMLLTKKNVAIEANGLLIGGKLYVGAGTKFLISFNRR